MSKFTTEMFDYYIEIMSRASGTMVVPGNNFILFFHLGTQPPCLTNLISLRLVRAIRSKDHVGAHSD